MLTRTEVEKIIAQVNESFVEDRQRLKSLEDEVKTLKEMLLSTVQKPAKAKKDGSDE